MATSAFNRLRPDTKTRYATRVKVAGCSVLACRWQACGTERRQRAADIAPRIPPDRFSETLQPTSDVSRKGEQE